MASDGPLARVGERIPHDGELRTDFIRFFAQELRTRLTTLIVGLELIAEDRDALPPSAARTAEILSDEVRQINYFINSILDLSHLGNERIPLVLGPVAVSVVTHRAVAGALVAQPDRTISTRIEGESLLAWADEFHLEHVLRTLITNSLHHAPRGTEVVVAVRRAGEMIEIEVADQGAHVDPEELAGMFATPLRRAEDFGAEGAVSRPHLTRATGLYVGKRLLEAQGGSISANGLSDGSLMAQGATFTITVPMAREMPADGDDSSG